MPRPRVRHETGAERPPATNSKFLGLQLGALLSGSVITETVFSLPGIGDLLIQSISARDHKLTQVLILFFTVMYFVVNLLVDLLYSWIDPRIKLS